MNAPRLYATFLLWMLSELFETLPEVGDLDKPKLVFFFDEAHLLFNDAPKALLERIEQVVRLVRCKGVGVYFVTQNPLDIPDTVLAQLGNRVQHALRAFTPRDQKAVQGGGRARCAPTRSSTSRPRSPSSPSARRWSASSTRRAGPSVTERVFVLPPGSQHRPDHARAAPGADRRARWSPASTRRRSTASRPTRSSRARVAAAPRAGGDAGGASRHRQASRAAGGGMMGGLKDILFGSTGPRGGKPRRPGRTAARARCARSARRSAARSCAACSARCSAAASAGAELADDPAAAASTRRPRDVAEHQHGQMRAEAPSQKPCGGAMPRRVRVAEGAEDDVPQRQVGVVQGMHATLVVDARGSPAVAPSSPARPAFARDVLEDAKKVSAAAAQAPASGVSPSSGNSTRLEMLTKNNASSGCR